jgi:hypothetical protein
MSSQRRSSVASRPPAMFGDAPAGDLEKRTGSAIRPTSSGGDRMPSATRTPSIEASFGSHVTCPASMIGIRSGPAIMRNLPISPPRL